MNSDALVRVGLRTIAIGIAIAALIDPSVTSRRSTKPDVVVLASDSVRGASLANDVARTVGKAYTVARTPLTGASATIVVGRTPPSTSLSLATPTFAVSPAGPNVEIEAMTAPQSAPSLARVSVATRLRVTSARAKSLDVTLRNGGVAVDHVTRRVERDDDTINVPLTFVPTTADVAQLRVVAHVDGGVDATGDAVVDVQDRKWAVLFYDPRPSWTSTFVRRAIERDPRFVATSRVVTSRDINTDAGTPPGRLDDLAALSLFDAVVVGAPQAMSTSDAAGLEAFMRRRGGSVVFLLDEVAAGPHDRLMGVASLASTTSNQVVALPANGADSMHLRAASMAWPSALPVGARSLAGGQHPIVWSEPVGAGMLVVSGALDAWRYRDPSQSSFDRFWQTTIANAADATPRPIVLATAHPIVAPGERFDVDATMRDEAIDAGTRPAGPYQVRASIGSATHSGDVLRPMPVAAGQLALRARAPQMPGVYQVALSVGDRRASIPVVVAADRHRVETGASADLTDWVRATGGESISASDIARLPSLLGKAIRSDPRLVTWHPMRSAWWMVPFVLALSAEWWLRRRRGYP